MTRDEFQAYKYRLEIRDIRCELLAPSILAVLKANVSIAYTFLEASMSVEDIERALRGFRSFNVTNCTLGDIEYTCTYLWHKGAIWFDGVSEYRLARKGEKPHFEH